MIMYEVFNRTTGEKLGHVYADSPEAAVDKYLDTAREQASEEWRLKIERLTRARALWIARPMAEAFGTER